MEDSQKQKMEEIYQNHAQAVYKYLCSLTHDIQLAEELTQETFYQAVKNINRFDGSCKILTWLCAIAKNQLSVYRRKHPLTENWESVTEQMRTQEKEVHSAEHEALGNLERIELLQKLHACPEPFREILYLRIFGGYSFREIGEVMGKTENWARVTFYRGKEKLARRIQDDAETEV